MKDRMKYAHMEVAFVYARLSHCKRRQVGCVVVKHLPNGMDNIISIGYNGTPSGTPNDCECNGITNKNVIHAEDNALKKLNNQAHNTSLFVTYEPCIDCAHLIEQSGVTSVYYYTIRDCDVHPGVDYLKANNITIELINSDKTNNPITK